MTSFLASSSALILATVLSTSAFADEDGITPYRPSVSSPAQLPLAGQLEMELGGLHTKAGDTRRDSLPYQFKLAFNKDWGVLLGGEAAVCARDGLGARERGIGDTTIVLKHAFLIDDATAFGMELGAKLPSARDTIGSGKADYTLNGIFSKDFGALHMDANLNFTRLGAIEFDSAHIQTGASASFSLPVAEHWGATAELAGTRRGGAASTSQLLAAMAYSPSKKLTIDFGVAKGLNDASPGTSLFAGLVFPLARLW